MTTSPGWASTGRSRRAASPSISPEYKAVLDRLIAEGLVYPAFMSRGEIRAFISEAGDAEEALAARSRRRAALSRRRTANCRRASGGGASPRACPMPGGSTSPPHSGASAAAAGLVGDRRRNIPTTAATGRSASRGLGRRGAGAQGRADQLSSVGRRRRCGAGHHPCGARPRPLPCDRRAAAAAGNPRPARAPLYFHHQLVEGPDGRKLSKSEKDTGLQRLREGGATPADIRRMVGLADERSELHPRRAAP